MPHASRDRRVAAAPISWGVCEVPGWGLQLPPDRVLREVADLDLTAMELGPLGWLGDDPGAVRARLDAQGLRLVGGFVPLVLHEPSRAAATRQEAVGAARLLAEAGGEVFVAAVVADREWSPRVRLDDDGLARTGEALDRTAELVAGEGVRLVLHPHVGTLVETAEDVERMLRATSVAWCLDTGHLLIGGHDGVRFARDHAQRVGHVHLKDVDAGLASAVRSGERTLLEATRDGLFRPLGGGDARVAEVVRRLDAAGYDGWLVLEQDAAIDVGREPAEHRGPIEDVRASLTFLAGLGTAVEA
jgi:inosose dehydratase